MTHDEILAVVTANRDGQPIEWWNVLTRQWLPWEQTDAAFLLSALSARAKLRVKPEPRRGFVADVFVYPTEAAARTCFPQAEIIEFLEVVK